MTLKRASLANFIEVSVDVAPYADVELQSEVCACSKPAGLSGLSASLLVYDEFESLRSSKQLVRQWSSISA